VSIITIRAAVLVCSSASNVVFVFWAGLQMSVYLGKARTFTRGANKWEYNCSCIVNNTKANGIKDYHVCFQKFLECNKNYLQIWKDK